MTDPLFAVRMPDWYVPAAAIFCVATVFAYGRSAAGSPPVRWLKRLAVAAFAAVAIAVFFDSARFGVVVYPNSIAATWHPLYTSKGDTGAKVYPLDEIRWYDTSTAKTGASSRSRYAKFLEISFTDGRTIVLQESENFVRLRRYLESHDVPLYGPSIRRH